MPRRPVGLLIVDMLERIERIRRFVAGLGHEAFLRDQKTIDSVVRNLEVIGEAAARRRGGSSLALPPTPPSGTWSPW